ncbi:hypothetical protein BDW69DRAFT_198463 [Aspergillus filifer]
MSSIPRDPVRIVEVSPRDGLQNIPEQIPTATKLSLIQRLVRTGLSTIEITSIVSPRAVPQLADCRGILGHETIRTLTQGPCFGSDSENDSGWLKSNSNSTSRTSLNRQSDSDIDINIRTHSKHSPGREQEIPLKLPVLIPNLKGLSIATSHGVRSISVFISATEPFSQNNTKCSVSEGITRARDVTVRAKEMGMSVRGYISCIFTDPISNAPTSPEDVLHCTRKLLEYGVDEVALSDTTGTGTPALVHSLTRYLTTHNIPLDKLAVHFHDSHARGLDNVWAAYEAGIRVFDGSVAGLGGCPFAPGARGNVATEEVVGMFESRGVGTGVDLVALEGVVRWVGRVLGQYQGGSGDGDRGVDIDWGGDGGVEMEIAGGAGAGSRADAEVQEDNAGYERQIYNP